MSDFFRENNVGDYFNANDVSMKYNVDIVFVVDATGSMGNLMETVKRMIPQFYNSTVTALSEKNKTVDTLRVRVIFFRDFLECARDRSAPLMATDFYVLSDKYSNQGEILVEQIESIQPFGGGDIPEDGLEALACAMKSDWCKKVPNHKRRHIIAVFTDAPTHELGFGKMSRDYPGGMPENFDELTQMWGDKLNRAGSMDYISKRLLLFIPKIEYLPVGDGWKDIVEGAMPWENCASYYLDLNNRHKSSTDGEKINMIIDRIVNSI